MNDGDSRLAISAARAGSAVLQQRFGTVRDRISKGLLDFATDVDLEAEQEIRRILADARPTDAVLGEENGISGPPDATRRWIVDPLCGTQNYVDGIRFIAVNVALRTNDGLKAAAVADPFADEVFWTDGDAAQVIVNDVSSALSPNAGSGIVELNLDQPYPEASEFHPATLLKDRAFTDRFRPRSGSSSLALTWVATGKRAAFVTHGDMTDNVHFAAGIAVCIAAGCSVTGFDGGPWQRAGSGLIATADEGTHDRLLKSVDHSPS